MEPRISIEGLSDFSRALKRLDSEAPKGLRLALNAGGNVVVDYGRSQMPSRTGRSRATIKAKSTRTVVRVSEGGKRAPWVPWLDFGGRVGRRRSVRRTFIKEGRYLYPALSERRAEIAAALERALTDVVRSVGLEID